MRRFWLLFSQVVTVLLAVYFVLISLKPQWLERRGGSAVAIFEAPADSTKSAGQPARRGQGGVRRGGQHQRQQGRHAQPER
jgi:hypothetical protein